MRKHLISAALLASTSSVALASPCVTGTFATYETSGFSCDVGDKTFSDFLYVVSANGVPTAADITITPEGAGSANPGLLFSDNWDNQTGVTVDASILFRVTENGPGSIRFRAQPGGCRCVASGRRGTFGRRQLRVRIAWPG